MFAYSKNNWKSEKLAHQKLVKLIISSHTADTSANMGRFCMGPSANMMIISFSNIYNKTNYMLAIHLHDGMEHLTLNQTKIYMIEHVGI